MTQTTKKKEFDGFTWELRLPSNIDTELDEGRQWEPEVRRWLDEYVKPGMYVADVGANFGYFTLILSRLVGPEGRVVAFEPEKVFFERLIRHIGLNKIVNIMPYKYALWRKFGHLQVAPNPLPYRSSARIFEIPHDSPDTYTVLGMKLDTLWENEVGAEQLNFIKIDVDGCELEVLRGAEKVINKFRPKMAVEFMVDEQGRQAAELLKSWNYRLLDHKDREMGARELGQIKSAGTINLLALPKG